MDSPSTLSSMPSLLPEAPEAVIFRPLCLSEARQLTLLLRQSLFPVRAAPKSLMSESIRLAEELHAVGIRWDRRRRVMGMHLRGIWEEGEKLGGSGGLEGRGHRAMERYVQGSFLTTAEDPHPLDDLPIPIELSTRSHRRSSLPKLTLQFGLAQTLGATGVPDSLSNSAGNLPSASSVALSGAVPLKVATACMPNFAISSGRNAEVIKGVWRDQRKTGLQIGTAFRINLGTGFDSPPDSATSPALALATSSSALFRGQGWTARTLRNVSRRLE